MDDVVGTDAVITSAADLSASFTPDAPTTEAAPAEPAEELSEPISPDAEGPESLLDDLNDTGAETADEEQEADAAAETEAEPADAAPATEELPEGVHAVDRNGKKEYRLNQPRYEAFHGAYKTLREFSEVAGEPITPEGFALRNNALISQERFYNDMLSGDPKAQAGVIGHLFAEAKAAMEGGEVAGNPMVPFTQTFYQHLRTADPDAYGALRHDAAKDLVEEMYAEAAANQNRGLFLSAGHIAKTLGLPFKAEAEMAEFFAKQGQVDPLSAKDKKIQELESQLNGRQAQNAERQFAAWHADTGKGVQAAIVDKAIMPSLSSIADQGYWKSHPDAFKDLVVNRLNSAAHEAIKKDSAFGDRLKLLVSAARRAVSEQKRGEIRGQIEQLYVNRANLAVEANKSQILKDANDRVKGQNAAAHERRKGAQTHRAPAGGGTPVRRSLVPTEVGDFEVGTADSLKASLNRLLA
jgi:hypothetical protein